MSDETGRQIPDRVSAIQWVEAALAAIGYEIIDLKKERSRDRDGKIECNGAVTLRIIPQGDDRAPDKVSENQRIATALEAIGYEIDEFKKEGDISPFIGNRKEYSGVISMRITPRM